MNTHILSESDFDTFIQEEIVPLIMKSQNKSEMTNTESGMIGAQVLALVGDLGAGKTTFSKKLLHTLGITQNITSPTFSIINSYDTQQEFFNKIFHIDVYRIEDLKELDVLHFDEIISQKNALVLIEWADMIKEKISPNAIWIEFEHDTNETRKVTIK